MRSHRPSGYGFGGPAAAAPGWRERFRRAAEQRGAVSEFIRFHPLRRNHELAGDGVEVAHVQDMVVVDVRAGDDALRAQMGSQGRRNLRRAEREGVTARLVDDMPAFHLRYIDAMRRLDAAPRCSAARRNRSRHPGAAAAGPPNP